MRRTAGIRATARRADRGFTLVELLVALFALSLLALMSWRGLDGMSRAQIGTQQRADATLALDTGLSQWGADLDAMVQLPQTNAIEWDGRVFRVVREAPGTPDTGVVVAAWTRRGGGGGGDGSGTWMRWQSEPLTTRGQVDDAWRRAETWSQTPSESERPREVAIGPLEDWQLFYFRSNAWTNPLSSDATAFTSPPTAPVVPGSTGAAMPAAGGGVVLGSGVNAAAPGGSGFAGTGGRNSAVVPDGVRLVMQLPPGGAINGRLVRDWIRPTVSGGRS